MTTSGSAVRGGDLASSPQSLRVVLRAELSRLIRQGGLRIGLIVTVLAGSATGLVTIATIAYLSQDQPGSSSVVTVTASVEVSASVTALVLSLCAVIYFGRQAQNGAVPTSLTLVPDRRRNFASQALATVIVGLGIAAVVLVVVAVSALAVSGSTEALAPAAIGAVSGAISAALLAALALFIAILANRAISAILLYVGWWIVLPLGLTLAAPFLPGWLIPITSTLADWIPTALLAQATTVSTLSTLGPSGLLQGLGGLVLWSGALGVAAAATAGRRSM